MRTPLAKNAPNATERSLGPGGKRPGGEPGVCVLDLELQAAFAGASSAAIPNAGRSVRTRRSAGRVS